MTEKKKWHHKKVTQKKRNDENSQESKDKKEEKKKKQRKSLKRLKNGEKTLTAMFTQVQEAEGEGVTKSWFAAEEERNNMKKGIKKTRLRMEWRARSA